MKNILLIINFLLIMNLKINSLYDIINVLYIIYKILISYGTPSNYVISSSSV